MSSSDSGLNIKDRFITDSGTGVKWGNLTMVVIGGLATAWGVGLGAIVDSGFWFLQQLVAGVGWFYTAMILRTTSKIIALGTMAWASAIGLVESLTGLWVPIAAIGVALAFLWMIKEGTDGD